MTAASILGGDSRPLRGILAHGVICVTARRRCNHFGCATGDHANQFHLCRDETSGAAAERECAMTQHRFQDIWKQQCLAARDIRVQHGVLSALDYLLGEKLLTYADMAVTRPEFARELPRFVAEVRAIFSDDELRLYLDHLERMTVIEDEHILSEDDDDFLKISPEQLAAKRARFVQLKELLTSNMLGTG